MAEQIYNSLVSYINEPTGVDDAQTTFNLIDTALFPDTGTYRIVVDAETMIVDSHAVGLLTVERGAEGTTASAHTNQSQVFLVWTAAGCIARWG